MLDFAVDEGTANDELGHHQYVGLYITGFLIFTGVADGSLFFASVQYLFRLDEFKPYCRISAYVGAVSSIVAASLFIIVDIGNPERVWLFITSGNFTSPMFWDFIILLSYMVISVIFTRQLILVHEGKRMKNRLNRLPYWLAAGILVLSPVCIQFPNGKTDVEYAGTAPSFLLAVFAVALAVLIILAFILNKIGYIHMPVPSFPKMAKLCALLLAAELLIIIGEVLVGLYPGAGGEYEAVSWLVAGGGAIRFWLEMAAVVGALILLTRQASEKGGTILFGAIFAFAAVYLIKSNFLQAELFHPLLNYAGPVMYGDGAFYYIPSLIEIGVSVGIVSLGAFLLVIGLRALKFGE